MMPKKRVSLTLEEELVEKIDEEASGKGLNRSQMVEDLVDGYFRGKSVDTAVVLCGDEENRSMEEYEGKPVLEHVLEHLSDEGVNRVVLLAGRNEGIEEYFGSSSSGMALDYVFEEDPRGTAAALRTVEDAVEGMFAVLNGHVISDVDLNEMMSLHREEDVLATMALTTVEDPSKYGVARLKGSRILGFEEKPEPGKEPSRLINAGTYVLDPEIFDRLDSDSLEDVFEQLASERSLAGYIYGGGWMDIDD